MPQQKPPMMVYPLITQPGIQRDGTQLASKRYVNGQWVRFQRGLPKKMGGFRQINANVNGPMRAIHTWSRQGLTQVTMCSPWGVEGLLIDANGVGQSIFDRTPSGYVVDNDVTWQIDTMYDAAAGSTKTLIFAFPGSNMTNIDSTVVRDIYYGDASATSALTAIGSSAQVSGGIVCASPYLIIFGSDGRVSWSNENEPRNFTTGSFGTARVTGSKIVRGLPIRGQGTSPSVLLWSLDSVIRMTYVGGVSIFRFDPVTNASSILSANSVIEYDGVYYWVGMGRFMMYNGTVKELPNDQNINWFFDNLNFSQRQKVFATKNPRYGEIWWFFPRNGETECSHAVIYNVRENYWYDVELSRSAGFYSPMFRYPLMASSNASNATVVARVPVADVTGYVIGDVITGGTSGAQGTLLKANGGYLYVLLSNSIPKFTNAETITGAIGGSQAATADSINVNLYRLWMHEFGTDVVYGDNQVAITSFFETNDFGFPMGGINEMSPYGPNRWTRLARIEPDLNVKGTMSMQVISKETADSPEVQTQEYRFDRTTENIDIRNQSRELRLRFISAEAGGDYECGRILLHLEEGDGRS